MTARAPLILPMILPLTLAVSLLAAATLPGWVENGYYVDIASQMLISGIFALGLNILVGHARLVSLGHAALFGVACYVPAILVAGGTGHLAAAILSVLSVLALAAVIGVLALRATGIGFLMITLACGQILWGVAYRWISVTNGENGLNLAARPMPFGLSLASSTAFYFATLAVFLAVLAAMAVFAGSPFGASLRGTRDQPRRMTALGYNVWLIRFLAFLISGLLTALSGLLFLYYNQFVSPHSLALATSAEAVLMVIVGGAGTLFGPVIGAVIVVAIKTIASAYVEHWNLVLGAVFVAIIIFMPDGLVPGLGRLSRALSAGRRVPVLSVRPSKLEDAR